MMQKRVYRIRSAKLSAYRPDCAFCRHSQFDVVLADFACMLGLSDEATTCDQYRDSRIGLAGNYLAIE